MEDYVGTVGQTFLGLTTNCARCHDHKFDAVSQREYYQFYAYFNQASDPGMQTRRGNQSPIVDLVDPNQEAKSATLKTQVVGLQEQLKICGLIKL